MAIVAMSSGMVKPCSCLRRNTALSRIILPAPPFRSSFPANRITYTVRYLQPVGSFYPDFGRIAAAISSAQGFGGFLGCYWAGRSAYFGGVAAGYVELVQAVCGIFQVWSLQLRFLPGDAGKEQAEVMNLGRFFVFVAYQQPLEVLFGRLVGVEGYDVGHFLHILVTR